jgi:hypothetical protein
VNALLRHVSTPFLREVIAKMRSIAPTTLRVFIIEAQCELLRRLAEEDHEPTEITVFSTTGAQA